jgi:hypothetical protein
MPKTASIKVNLANNTLAGNSAAVLAALSAAGLLPASDLDTDATMAANSDAKVPSQKATRAYVASVLAGVAKNKGPLDCSANPNYPVGLNGDFYRCSVAGKVGGASGIVVEVADLIMCVADNAGGTQASVGTSWIVGQANIAGITAAGLAMLQAADATAQAALLAAVTETLTNKRITQRVGSTTSSATPTINTDNVDRYDLTAQAADITSFTSNLSGTPTNGQALWISVTGTAARAITWGASFENGAATLPTTTVSTDRLDVLFVWNSVTSKWRCVLTTTASGGGTVTPYNAGDLTGDVTLSLDNGAVQHGAQTGNISIEVPTGTPVEKVSAIELYVTGNGGTLDFDAGIIRASDSAASFPKTLTDTKVYLLQLRYFKTQWNLVTLVGGY